MEKTGQRKTYFFNQLVQLLLRAKFTMAQRAPLVFAVSTLHLSNVLPVYLLKCLYLTENTRKTGKLAIESLDQNARESQFTEAAIHYGCRQGGKSTA